jgi:hypothetical protein
MARTVVATVCVMGLSVFAGCGGGGSSATFGTGPAPGGAATHSRVAAPEAVALDANGNLYVSEFEGNRVRPDCAERDA